MLKKGDWQEREPVTDECHDRPGKPCTAIGLDAVFWVDIDLAIKEGLTFYQTRSNAIILQGTLPAHCILKVERLKTGEKLYER